MSVSFSFLRSEKSILDQETARPHSGSVRGQAILSAVLAVVVLLIILYSVFSDRLLSEMRFVKMSIEDETALFLAEGCIEEGLLTVRTGANDSASPIFQAFRNRQPCQIPLRPDRTLEAAQVQFPGQKISLRVTGEIGDIKPFQDDLVPDSTDRSGHLILRAEAEFGRGKSSVREVRQFRIQDVATPNPLKKFGLVWREYGLENAFGKISPEKLPDGILRVIRDVWRAPVLFNDVVRNVTGYPFVRQRISYFSPDWGALREYFQDQGSYWIYGDFLCNDSRDLDIADVPLNGAGRILSQSGRVVLRHLLFHPSSCIGFGVLAGGEVCLEGFPKEAPARVSVFLPSGRITVRDESYVEGFFLLDDVDIAETDFENPEARKRLKWDERLTSANDLVVISGQTETWRSTP